MSAFTVGPTIRGDGAVHVRGCDTCDGDGWVIACFHGVYHDCGGVHADCPDCKGKGFTEDEDCDCPGCCELVTVLEAA
jgi:hypothetical protein